MEENKNIIGFLEGLCAPDQWRLENIVIYQDDLTGRARGSKQSVELHFHDFWEIKMYCNAGNRAQLPIMEIIPLHLKHPSTLYYENYSAMLIITPDFPEIYYDFYDGRLQLRKFDGEKLAISQPL